MTGKKPTEQRFFDENESTIMQDKKIAFEYTDEFLKKAKYFPFYGYIKLGILCLVLWYLTELTKNIPRPPLGIAILIIVLFVFVLFMTLYWCLGEISRDYKQERIYIEGGLLHIKKCFKTRVGNGYVVLVFKNITGFEITGKKIKVYGNIIFNNGSMTRVLAKNVFSAELKNKDELIKFIQSKIVSRTEQKAALHFIKDQKVETVTVRHKAIWRVVNRAFLRILIKSIWIEGFTLVIGLICYFKFSGNENTLLLIIILTCILVFVLTLLCSTIYLITEYVIDILLKRINRYTGYFSNVQPVDTKSNNMLIPVKHYRDYSHALFYHKPGLKEAFIPVTTGDLKSDPVDGRRFLLKESKLLEGIGKNQKVEVLYLPISKIVVSVKMVE